MTQRGPHHTSPKSRGLVVAPDSLGSPQPPIRVYAVVFFRQVLRSARAGATAS